VLFDTPSVLKRKKPNNNKRERNKEPLEQKQTKRGHALFTIKERLFKSWKQQENSFKNCEEGTSRCVLNERIMRKKNNTHCSLKQIHTQRRCNGKEKREELFHPFSITCLLFRADRSSRF